MVRFKVQSLKVQRLQSSKRFAIWHTKINILLSLLVVGVIGATGYRLDGYTKAATVNPYGFIDYCSLVNNQTIIYGWAADPSTSAGNEPYVTIVAGSTSITTASSVIAYRDTPINNYIDANYRGDPKPGIYGFQASFGNLTKGTSYIISGTAINFGPGANTKLSVNQSGSLDGIARPTFGGLVIPDTCLAVAPATPAPAPVPAPRPAPVPTPAPTPAPSTPKTVVPPTALSPASDATVIAGSYGVSAKVPAGNAANIWIEYGTDITAVSTKSDIVAVSGAEVKLDVRGLQPNLLYQYRIVRQAADGTTVNSATGNFMTEGIDVRIQAFAGSKPIKGLSGKLAGRSMSTTDSKGFMTFTGMKPGNLKFDYTYRGAKLSKIILVKTSGQMATQPADAIERFNYRLDVPTVVSVRRDQDTSDIPWRLIAALSGVFFLIITVIYLFKRLARRTERRKQAVAADDYDTEAEIVAPLFPSRQQSESENIGKSLRQMVIESMAEEARQRRAAQSTPEDKKDI